MPGFHFCHNFDEYQNCESAKKQIIAPKDFSSGDFPANFK